MKRKNFMMVCLVGLFMFLLPIMLLAADDSAKALDPVWAELGHYIGVLVAAAVSYLAALILKQLQEWKLLKAENAAQYEAKLQVEAQKIVVGVEAWAKKQGRKLGAEEKLAKAIGKMATKFSFLTEEQAGEYVESALIPLGQGLGKLIQKAPLPAALQ